jgi:hypothetical protein
MNMNHFKSALIVKSGVEGIIGTIFFGPGCTPYGARLLLNYLPGWSKNLLHIPKNAIVDPSFHGRAGSYLFQSILAALALAAILLIETGFSSARSTHQSPLLCSWYSLCPTALPQQPEE